MLLMELPYIAGLFDGEGCVRINRRVRYGKPGETRKSCEMYILYVQVSNLDPAVLYPLKERFGGSIHVTKHKNPTQRDVLKWMASTWQALEFLKAIRPWLVVKADQVDIAIEFQEAKARHGRGGFPPGYRERERRQYAEITALKYQTYDPSNFDKAANSGDTENRQSRAKQEPQAPGVCNDQVLPSTEKIWSDLHRNMQSAAEMTAPGFRAE